MCEALPFKPYTQKDIIWEKLDEDDFIGTIQRLNIKYTLRVEQMDKNAWWCSFYINGNQEWDNNGEWVKTESEAKRQVLRALNEHGKRV